MDRRSGAVLALVVAVALAMPAGTHARGPGGGGGGGGSGGHEETSGKNLSFPAITTDGFAIAPITAPVFGHAYAGSYPGLDAAAIAWLQANGPWYPQETAANVWQAGHRAQVDVDVTWVDWGDNLESVNPRVGYPFRLEVVLYRALDAPLTAYTMAALENPSSSTELQGTNGTTYQSAYATIVSPQPRLVIQQLGTIDPATLTWDGARWMSGAVVPRIVPVAFAPELNVGGRYIYGATMGGWRPDVAGRYRITFAVPLASGVALTTATGVGNYADGFAGGGSHEEGGAATPVIDAAHGLSYVDVVAGGGRGGGGGGGGGGH